MQYCALLILFHFLLSFPTYAWIRSTFQHAEKGPIFANPAYFKYRLFIITTGIQSIEGQEGVKFNLDYNFQKEDYYYYYYLDVQLFHRFHPHFQYNHCTWKEFLTGTKMHEQFWIEKVQKGKWKAISLQLSRNFLTDLYDTPDRKAKLQWTWPTERKDEPLSFVDVVWLSTYRQHIYRQAILCRLSLNPGLLFCTR